MDDLKQRAEIVLEKLNIVEKGKRFREIEAESMNPAFWQDNERATKLMQEMALLQKETESYEKIKEILSGGNYEDLANSS